MITVGAGSSRPDNSKINICDNSGRDNLAPTLGQIIAYFKYQSTKEINDVNNNGINKIWQRNYYEHIVHDDGDLQRIQEYIENNPANWLNDKLFSPNFPNSL